MDGLEKIAPALVEFQSRVPEIKKAQTANAGKYSYSYADLATIWAAIRKPLSDAKLSVVQVLNGGQDGYTKLTTIVMHESGQKIESVLDLPTSGKTPQEAGSLFTYYKRYALSAMLGISTEDDDDGKASNKPPVETKPTAPRKQQASESQRVKITDLAQKAGYDEEWIDGVQEKVKLADDASKVIKQLEAKTAETPKDPLSTKTLAQIKKAAIEAGASAEWLAGIIASTVTEDEGKDVLVELADKMQQEPQERVWK